MRSRFLAVVVALTAATSPRSLTAQTTVTFEVPVKVTQLSTEILKIRVLCNIRSDAIVAPSAGGASEVDEVPVVGGQVVTTMRVIFVFPEGTLRAPVGKTATYSCELGLRTATGAGAFSETSSNLAHVVKPQPAVITGTFVW
jgi:hypothetical protein